MSRKNYYDNMGLMITIASQIDTLKKKIDTAKKNLQLSYEQLGQQIVKNKEIFPYLDDEDLSKELDDLIFKDKSLQTSINEVQQTIEKIQKNDKGITNLSSNLEHFRKQFQSLLEMLGANVVEVYDSGKLSEELFYCIMPLLDYRKKKKKTTNSKLLKTVFYKTGKLVYYSERGNNISNFRAQAILAELYEINALRLKCRKNISEHKAKLDSLEKSYGAVGVVNIRLRELKMDKNSHTNLLNSAFQKYGEKLYKLNNDQWEKEVPLFLKEELEKVKKDSNQISFYDIQMKYLDVEQNIISSGNRISQYTERLNYLKKQKSALEEAQKKAEDNIEIENNQIKELKKTQTELEKKAEGLI
ncbi:MAG: hypothetical protein WC162_00470 [Sphaerochaetaceae bacterium]|nr:hypothetical protein [Sphaerochaetaceae bacterium]